MQQKKHLIIIKTLIIYTVFTFLLVSSNASEVLKGRQTISLNGEWLFKTDNYNQGIDEKWFLPDSPIDTWEKIQVPGNWDIKNKYANYSGKAWYRKNIMIPAYSNKTVNLCFEAVGMSYKLFVNGKLVSKILSGNNIETFNITHYLIPTRWNSIVVEVDNTLKWGAYWSWGGIRRSVEIQIEEQLNIVRQQILPEVNLENATALIKTTVFLSNESNVKKEFAIQQLVFIGDQLVKQSSVFNLAIAPHTNMHFEINVALPKEETKLWHFDHPNMYNSLVQLTSGDKLIYSQKDKFGVRKIELKNNRLFLNGEPIRLVGYNWVAEDRTTGSTLPEFRYKQDIDLMKSAGANMARLSHRPLPQDVMDYLDLKGILLFAEFNNWPDYMNNQSREPIEFAEKLIGQNFNHPSVIGWSVGNENGNLKDFPKVNEYVSSIVSYIKRNLDSSRLITYASHTADIQDNDAAQFCDIILINRYGNYQESINNLEKRYPGKAIFMSEYGGHTYNMINDTPDKSLFSNLMVDSLYQFKN